MGKPLVLSQKRVKHTYFLALKLESNYTCLCHETATRLCNTKYRCGVILEDSIISPHRLQEKQFPWFKYLLPSLHPYECYRLLAFLLTEECPPFQTR